MVNLVIADNLYRRHQNCTVHVVRFSLGPHRAQLRCRDHNCYLKWLTRQEADRICLILEQAELE